MAEPREMEVSIEQEERRGDVEVGICNSSSMGYYSTAWTKDMEHFILEIAARDVNCDVKNALSLM